MMRLSFKEMKDAIAKIVPRTFSMMSIWKPEILQLLLQHRMHLVAEKASWSNSKENQAQNCFAPACFNHER